MAGYGLTDNIFTAMIDEQGTIWEAGTGRKRQAVGIDAQKEQDYQTQIAEMQGVIENYYGKLVELGAITPPKSAEQIAQEQAAQQTEINRTLLEAIQGLQSEIRGLKANGDAGSSFKFSEQSIGQDSASAGKIAGASKKRNSTGDKNAPGDNE